jgi:hypothetical protein
VDLIPHQSTKRILRFVRWQTVWLFSCFKDANIEQAKAEKLQAAAESQRKKDTSNFLVPPCCFWLKKQLSSLSSLAEIATTSIASPNFPSSFAKRLSNNKQDAVADLMML